MRIALLAAAAALSLGASMASAQDSSSAVSLRGFRIEGNAGWDRFSANGNHNSKFGYGGTVGFDGQIGEHIVIGPEASYWRANDWTGSCGAQPAGGNACTKSFEEWGAAVRAGYLVTPGLLIFGKGGYVNNEQRKAYVGPAGQPSFYDHYRTDGYQYGGGVEFSLTQFQLPAPVYVSAQYVRSNYDDHTHRDRVMGGIGIRFK